MLRVLLCGVALLGLLYSGKARGEEVDTLYNQLAKSDQAEKALILNKLGEYYLNVNRDSAAYYTEKAYQQATLVGDEKNELTSELRAAYILLLGGKYQDAFKEFTSLKVKADSLNEPDNMISARTFIGGYYYMTGGLDSALRYFDNANELCKLHNNTRQMMRNTNNMGSIYYMKGDLSKALTLYLETQKLADSIQDNQILTTLLLNLGNIYMERKEYDQSIENFKKGAKLAQETNVITVYGHCMNNLGIIYRMNDEFDSSLYFTHKAYKTYREIGNVIYEATSLGNIGYAHDLLGNSDSALYYSLKSLELSKQSNNERQQIITLQFLGEIYETRNNPHKALDCFFEAIEIARKTGAKPLESSLLSNIAWNYYDMGEFEKAFNFLTDYNAINDSIKGVEQEQYVAKLQTEFESEQKEKENELLRMENNLAEIKIVKQGQRLAFLIVSLIVLLGLIVSILILYRKRNIANRELKKLNQALEDSNRTMNKFFSIVSHDLRSPFNSIIGFSDLLQEELQNKNYPEKVERYSNVIHITSQKILTLVNNLLEWASAQQGRIKFNPKPFVFRELVEENFELFTQRSQEKQVDLKMDLDIPEQVFADRDLVNIILRNLISNAIKFTEKGSVTVQAKKGVDEIIVSVIDSGVGISENDQMKLFRLDSNFSKKGTQKESGTGLGLVLCREFVEKHGGKIWVESEMERGSSFKFTLRNDNSEIVEAG